MMNGTAAAMTATPVFDMKICKLPEKFADEEEKWQEWSFAMGNFIDLIDHDLQQLMVFAGWIWF